MLVNKKILIPLSILFLSSSGIAQVPEVDLLNALYESQEKPNANIDVAGPTKIPERLGESSSMQGSKVCGVSDQTSMPLRMLLGLLRNRGAALEVSHNADKGELSVYGGPMIGNCNSMLDFKISQPSGELPYVLEAKFKACGSGKTECSYEVIKDGEVSSMSFAPTQAGFMSCLNATGVIADGKINADKINKVELNLTQSGVNQTAELWYASHGPSADNLSGVYSKNKYPKMGCYYFEDVVENGFRVYSKNDIATNRKKDEFEVLCQTGNYRLIDERIGDFEGFQALESMLIAVRNRLIEEDVRKLAAQLKTEKDYSELDITVINDFYEKIILPKKAKIAEKYKEYLAATGDHRFAVEKELQAMQDELVRYSEDPYLTKESRASLILSQQKNAPMHLDSWHTGTLTLNKTLETIDAYKSFKGSTASGAKKSPLTAEQQINAKQGEYANLLKEARYKHEIRNNYIEGSPSADLFAQSTGIKRAVAKRNQDLQQNIQEELMYIQNHCYNPNKYWINRQKCVAESQENIAYWTQAVKALNERDIAAANKIHARGQELAAEEAKRPKDGVKRASASSSEKPEGIEHTNEQFVFDFRNAREQETQMMPQNQQQMQMQQQYMQQGQWSPGMSMQQYSQQNPGWQGGLVMGNQNQMMTGQPQYYQQNQMMMGQPQYYQQNQMMMGQPQYYQQNNGMGLNFGFNAGMGMGMGQQYGNYGMQQPFSMGYPYMNNQYGMYNFR